MISGTGAEAIASNVEEAVSTGAMAPGAELPSIRELATRLGVNANTVAAAYRLLRERGAVETAGRRGTRVRDRPATTPRSLRGLTVPPGVRDLSTGNPDPALLPIAAAQFPRVVELVHLANGVGHQIGKWSGCGARAAGRGGGRSQARAR